MGESANKISGGEKKFLRRPGTVPETEEFLLLIIYFSTKSDFPKKSGVYPVTADSFS